MRVRSDRSVRRGTAHSSPFDAASGAGAQRSRVAGAGRGGRTVNDPMSPVIVPAIIFARGGSKGVPRKNMALLAGKPCIGWTIDAALSSRHISHVAVSSDDAETIEYA